MTKDIIHTIHINDNVIHVQWVLRGWGRRAEAVPYALPGLIK